MSKKLNEKNACDAFIDIIKQITGIEYYKPDEKSLDESNRTSQDVDYILISKDGQYPRIAVEHTIIEAHNNQILYVDQLCDIGKEIEKKCQGKLPTDRFFELIVPPPLVVGTNKKSRNQFIEKMTIWILDEAKKLNADQGYSNP